MSCSGAMQAGVPMTCPVWVSAANPSYRAAVRLRAEDAGNAEVRQQRRAVAIQQHIGALHVAVNHALPVRIVERAGNLAQVAGDILQRHGPAAILPARVPPDISGSSM